MSLPRRLAMTLGLLGAAVLAQTPGVASGEPPIDAHLIAPNGAEVVTNPVEGPLHADHGAFLDEFEGLDVQRQGGALGLVQRGDDRVLVTAVRLRDDDEAARALAAFVDWSPDAVHEIAPDRITRRMKLQEHGHEMTMVEVARATGRDLIFFAQLDLNESEVTPFTREVVEVHRAAFPAVTPPAAVGPRFGGWLLPVMVGLGMALVALGFVLARRRRKRTLSTPPTTVDPTRITVHW